ncbi:MAG: CDP-glucose 4,6-dehydratase [Clostridiales bacterium]|nr:CDP-glucose 4,6-dehydratase [Clostridiales bacterium]
MFDITFYKGKRVFITGHTGFKGSWLCKILADAGAVVTGYSLEPEERISLFKIAHLEEDVHSIYGDIRDYSALKEAFDKAQPEIVFHLAAQSIVREGYNNPAYTYETNIMGTVNILECIRHNCNVKSFVNVTTDKVYLNREWEWGYRENDVLNGYDPYSNSKSCSELITHTYKRCFFSNETEMNRVAVSTVRAGNVIGGGDFANYRIIPDCVRAAMEQKDIVVRNPFSIRPYQHVLEPLYVYLMIAANQYNSTNYSDWYNVGPNDSDCLQTGELVELFVKYWGNHIKWVSHSDDSPHEASFLKLDCSKLKKVFGWSPNWDIETAVAMTVEWYKCWAKSGDIRACMDKQIDKFYRSSLKR